MNINLVKYLLVFVFVTEAGYSSDSDDCQKFISFDTSIRFDDCQFGLMDTLDDSILALINDPVALEGVFSQDFDLLIANRPIVVKARLSKLKQTENLVFYPISGALSEFDAYLKTGAGVQKLSIQTFEDNYYISLDQIDTGTFELYLKIKSEIDLPGSYWVKDKQDFFTERFNQQLILSSIIGILVALLIYNLFLAFAVLFADYFKYVLFLTVNTLLSCVAVNFPYNVGIHFGIELSSFVLRPFAIVSHFLFFVAILRLADNFPGLCRAFKLFASLILVIGLLGLNEILPFATAQAILDLHIMLYLLFSIAFAILAIYRRLDFSVCIGLSQFALFLSILIYMVQLYGQDPPDYWIHSVPILGLSVEAMLMAFALGRRFSLLERDKIVAEFRAEKADELRQLNRVLSHDIRNPLSAVQGATDLAIRKLDENDTEAAINWIEKISRASSTISEILDDASSEKTIVSGKSVRLEDNVDIEDLFSELEFLFTEKSKAKSLSLEFVVEDNLSVIANRKRLKNQVLANLISNSIKFTHANGKITVTAKRFATGFVELSVDDNGIGIAKEKQQDIFSDHVNTSTFGTDGESGSGFGMPIVWSSVTNDFGGKITIVSKTMDEYPDGHGTRVAVLLRSKTNRNGSEPSA